MTNNKIDGIVDKLCSEVYEDWHIDVTKEVREEWRKPVRQTITELLEGLRMRSPEDKPEYWDNWSIERQMGYKYCREDLNKKIDEILNN